MGHTEFGSLSVAGERRLGGTTSTSLKTIPLPGGDTTLRRAVAK
jgi:hypothetical protein